MVDCSPKASLREILTGIAAPNFVYYTRFWPFFKEKMGTKGSFEFLVLSFELWSRFAGLF